MAGILPALTYPKLHQLWEAQLSVMGVSAGAKKTSILVLQIVLDRLLKRMVTMKKEEVDRPPQPLPVKTLTIVGKIMCATGQGTRHSNF